MHITCVTESVCNGPKKNIRNKQVSAYMPVTFDLIKIERCSLYHFEAIFSGISILASVLSEKRRPAYAWWRPASALKTGGIRHPF